MAQTAPGKMNQANIKKLLLPVTLAKAGWAIVEAREDVQGVPYDVAGGKAELHRKLEDVAGVALSVQPFSDPELDAGPSLEVVARIGVGYDAVDAKHAGSVGVMVTNTPDVLTEEVADTAIGLLLNTVRELPKAEAWLRAGKWVSQGNYPLTRATLRGRLRSLRASGE